MRRLLARLLLQALTAWAVLMPPGQARAEPEPREVAKSKVAEGAQLYAQGRFADAVVRYLAAYAVFPSPKVHYNLALAYRRMGRLAQSYAAFDRFLRDAKDAAPVHIQEARLALKQLSAQVGFLEVQSDAADAEASLDGTALGPIPVARLPVDVGRRELVVSSKTLGTRSRSFQVAAGVPIVLHVALRSPVQRPGLATSRPPSEFAAATTPSAFSSRVGPAAVAMLPAGWQKKSMSFTSPPNAVAARITAGTFFGNTLLDNFFLSPPPGRF
jgi:hypothetical protein